MKHRNPIGCGKVLRQLFEYLDEQLNAVKRWEVDRHLNICRGCSARVGFEKRLRRLLRTVSRKPVRAALKQRVRSLMRKSESQ